MVSNWYLVLKDKVAGKNIWGPFNSEQQAASFHNKHLRDYTGSYEQYDTLMKAFPGETISIQMSNNCSEKE
ncbi:MAG: hypothetical protein CTY28_06995 [Hyphomicrobium sp.]|nr:MAG: hypothetical protein CTY28_06995 [Hyphomicrobium sp.]